MRNISSSATIKMPVMGGEYFAPSAHDTRPDGAVLQLPPVVFVGQQAHRAVPFHATLTPLPRQRGHSTEALESRQKTAVQRRILMAKHIRKGLSGVSSMILHAPDALGRCQGSHSIDDEVVALQSPGGEERTLKSLRHIGVKSNLRRTPGLTFSEAAEQAAAAPGGSTMGLTVHAPAVANDVLSMRPLTVVTLEDLDLDDRTPHETVAAMCGTRRKTTIEEVLQERGYASHHVVVAEERSKLQRRYEAQAAAFGLLPAQESPVVTHEPPSADVTCVDARVTASTSQQLSSDQMGMHGDPSLLVSASPDGGPLLSSSNRKGVVSDSDDREVIPSKEKGSSSPMRSHSVPLTSLDRRRQAEESRRRGKLFSRTLATRLADLDFNFIPADHAPVLPSAQAPHDQKHIIEKNHPKLKPPREVEAEFRWMASRDDVDAPIVQQIPISVALRMESDVSASSCGAPVGSSAGTEAILRDVFELASRTTSRFGAPSTFRSHHVAGSFSTNEAASHPTSWEEKPNHKRCGDEGSTATEGGVRRLQRDVLSKPPRSTWKRVSPATPSPIHHHPPTSITSQHLTSPTSLSALAMWYHGTASVTDTLPPPSQGSTLGRHGVVSLPPSTVVSRGGCSSSVISTPGNRPAMTPVASLTADRQLVAPPQAGAARPMTLADALGFVPEPRQ